MQTHLRPLVSWQDNQFVTLAEAARVAGRSYSWARDCVVDGRLHVGPTPQDGPIVITVASLKTQLEVLANAAIRRRPAARGRTHLRLVVDNTHQ